MMKTLQTIGILTFLLVASTCVSACSNNDDNYGIAGKEGVVTTTKEGGLVYGKGDASTNDDSSSLAQFFNEELRMPCWDGEGNIHQTFFGPDLSWDAEVCLMINSKKEFQAAYKGDKELPAIDFDKNTLVIGLTRGNDYSYFLDHITLTNKGKWYEMETTIHHYTTGFWPAATVNIMYWQLYPKLTTMPVKTKRTIVDVEHKE